MKDAYAILSYVAWSAVQYISALSDKRRNFRKKVTEHKMCFDFLYNFCLNIFHSKKKQTRYDKKCTLVFM